MILRTKQRTKWGESREKVEEKAENKVNTKVGYSSIPNENFENALIELGFDDVIDGKVLSENISSTDSLDISNKKISDLYGIEAFTALTHLICGNNRLISLDISKSCFNSFDLW